MFITTTNYTNYTNCFHNIKANMVTNETNNGAQQLEKFEMN